VTIRVPRKFVQLLLRASNNGHFLKSYGFNLGTSVSAVFVSGSERFARLGTQEIEKSPFRSPSLRHARIIRNLFSAGNCYGARYFGVLFTGTF
jgi:hypothetical protein